MWPGRRLPSVCPRLSLAGAQAGWPRCRPGPRCPESWRTCAIAARSPSWALRDQPGTRVLWFWKLTFISVFRFLLLSLEPSVLLASLDPVPPPLPSPGPSAVLSTFSALSPQPPPSCLCHTDASPIRHVLRTSCPRIFFYLKIRGRSDLAQHSWLPGLIAATSLSLLQVSCVPPPRSLSFARELCSSVGAERSGHAVLILCFTHKGTRAPVSPAFRVVSLGLSS